MSDSSSGPTERYLLADADAEFTTTLGEISRALEGVIEKSGLPAKVDAAAKRISALDTALTLSESDPHQWSSRPCSTRSTITNLIGRPFGCAKLWK